MSFGPASCPVCGSIGARALMLDHIESAHSGRLVVAEDPEYRILFSPDSKTDEDTGEEYEDAWICAGAEHARACAAAGMNVQSRVRTKWQDVFFT